jgi:GNAT superfamily N-acetyltransferase
VIVRVDTSRAQLLEKLQSLDAYESLVADTLVYFKWGAQVGIGLVDGESGFAIADTATQDEVIDLIADSFGAYRNHYGANPRLGQGATLNGYKEWASSLMATSGSVTLVARDRSTSRALGFVLMVVDRSRRLAEIMLNGVHPMVRRRGVYSALLNAAKSHLESVDSSWPLYISTQSDNYSVIGAWTKLGLAPDVSLATIHLMHRDYFVS